MKFYGIKNGTPGGADVPTPRKVVLEFYSRGGDLTLGFMTENTNCNWFGIDNVKLEYMGSEGGLAAELARTVKKCRGLFAGTDRSQCALLGIGQGEV